jgi:protein-disulfide isomerase
MPKRADFRERRAQRKRRDRITYALIIAGIVLLLGFVVLLPSLTPVGEVATPVAADYPSPDDHALGDPNAAVVIEEFSDFQCPFCRRFHDETFPRIVDEYVRTGKVYFVYRHFPIVDRDTAAQESHAAAAAAICAGRQNRFWDYQDVLFANQTGENIGDFSDRRLEAMAEAIGLDLGAFNDCFGSQDARAAVAADALLATQNGLSSTPSFLVNGKAIIGAQPFEAFQQAIEAELSGG